MIVDDYKKMEQSKDFHVNMCRQEIEKNKKLEQENKDIKSRISVLIKIKDSPISNSLKLRKLNAEVEALKTIRE